MRYRMNNMTVPLVITVLSVLSSASIGSESAGAEVSSTKTPRIGDTKILTTSYLPDPFIDTRISIGFGYGKSTDISTPLIEIGGEPVLGLEGALLFALLGLDYRYAVRDWIAVWVRLSLAARLGSELQSILAQGLNAYNGFEFGWLVRLHEGDRHLLSSAVMIRNSSSTIVDILGFTTGIVEGAEEHHLVYGSPMLSTILDARYAYAVNGALALQMLGQLSYGEAVERREENKWYYSAGAAASLDLQRRTTVPLGLTLGFKYSTIPEIGDRITDRTKSILACLTYVGRKDFRLGLEVSFQRRPIVGLEEKVWITSGLISMQYYF